MNNFYNSDIYNKIFYFHETIPNRIKSRESSWLEFKESFNWDFRDRYAKTIAAFANTKGGYIVFGIKDKPRDLIGLQSSNFEITDEQKITSYLNTFFSPEIAYEKFTIGIRSRIVGILHIEQVKIKPVVCLKNDGALKEADIYYRYTAISERIKYAELKTLFDLVKDEERRTWLEHFEKISKIGPTNAGILDTVSGEITGKSGTLVIDKKLIPKLRFINEGTFREGGKSVLKLVGDVKPVSIIAKSEVNKNVAIQITNDSSAPAYRLEEEVILKKKYPLDFKTLSKKLSRRYTNFKINSKFHKIRKELMKDPNLSKRRYLNPNNNKSSSQDFYSPLIVKQFDEYYKRRNK